MIYLAVPISPTIILYTHKFYRLFLGAWEYRRGNGTCILLWGAINLYNIKKAGNKPSFHATLKSSTALLWSISFGQQYFHSLGLNKFQHKLVQHEARSISPRTTLGIIMMHPPCFIEYWTNQLLSQIWSSESTPLPSFLCKLENGV